MANARVSSVSPGSPGEKSGLVVGDEIVTIGGVPPTDVIEYQRLVDGENVDFAILRDGVPLSVSINKNVGEPIGVSIESALFDRVRTCDNHCSFCFIYQLPKGLRRSLYVKDDDYRLSFLYGNYTTLTRFTEFDLERVLSEKLSPLYVSIHTTTPSLRAEMLRNPRGATSLRWLDELLRNGIQVHGQVVLCPGVNDGEWLDDTLADVITKYPDLASLSVVPIGISDFSTEQSMRSLTGSEASRTIDQVRYWNGKCRELLGRDVMFCSDELYLVAGVEPDPLPTEAVDELIENGIGLIQTFSQSFRYARPMVNLGSGFFQSVDGAPAQGYRAKRVTQHASSTPTRSTIVLTSEYFQPRMQELLNEAHLHHVRAVAVRNEYFGGNIKVAGLMTGADVTKTMLDHGPDFDYVLPDVCLSEDLFLDGSRLEDLPFSPHVVATNGFTLRQYLDSALTNEEAL